MKKIIIVAVILILALLVGAPYVTGKVAETETRKILEVISQDPTLYGEAEIVSYERSYFSTSANYTYSLPPVFAAMTNSVEPIEYSCDSKHGVIGIKYVCQLKGDTAYSKFVAEKLGGNDPFSMHGTVSIFGNITQNLELDAIQDLDVDGETINTPHALISLTTDKDMEYFEFTGKTGEFNFDNEQGKLNMSELTFDGNLTSIAPYVYVGDMDMNLDKLSIKDENQDISLNGFSFTSETSQNGDNIDSEVNFKLASVNSPNPLFSSIENVDMKMDLNGVDTQAFSEYQAFSMKMQRDVLSSVESGNEAQMDPNMMLQILPIMEKMLKSGLEMNLDLSTKLDGANNSIRLDSKLLESLSFTEMTMFMTAPEQAFKKLNVKLNADFDKSVVDSQPMFGGFISQSPLVKQVSDSYKVDLKLGDTFELNGEQVTVEELYGMVFGSMRM